VFPTGCWIVGELNPEADASTDEEEGLVEIVEIPMFCLSIRPGIGNGKRERDKRSTKGPEIIEQVFAR